VVPQARAQTVSAPLPPGKVTGIPARIPPGPTQPVGSANDVRHKAVARFQAAFAKRQSKAPKVGTPLPPPLARAQARIRSTRSAGLLPATRVVGDGKHVPVPLNRTPYGSVPPEGARVPGDRARTPQAFGPLAGDAPSASAGAVPGAAALPSYGARYEIRSGWDPAPSYFNTGNMWVRVFNTSSVTWPAGTVGLGFHVYRDDNSEYKYRGLSSVINANMPPSTYLDLFAFADHLPAGKFKLVWDLIDYSASVYFSQRGVPASQSIAFEVPYYPPTAELMSPENTATVDTLTPTFQVGVYGDGTRPLWVFIKVCAASGTCWNNGSQSVTLTGSFFTTVVWQPPPTALRWNTAYSWQVRLEEASGDGPFSPLSSFIPVVPNPEGAGHYGVDPAGLDAAGVNMFAGNYTRQEHDLTLPAPQSSVPLAIDRVYNSASQRSGAFGVGWSSVVDVMFQRSTSSPFTTITFPDGKQTNFGFNPDGSSSPGFGESWTTRLDVSKANPTLDLGGGTRYTFAGSVNSQIIRSFTSANGRTLDFGQSNGHIFRIDDAMTGRTLWLDWTGSHVTRVSTASTPGPGVLSWTYSYTGDLLTQVCDSEPTPNCTQYGYGATTSAHPTPRLVLVRRPNSDNKTAINYDGEFVSLVGFPADSTGVNPNSWRYTRAAPPVDHTNSALVLQVQDPTGVRVNYEFDLTGGLSSRWFGPSPVAPVRHWLYDPWGRVAAMLDENNNLTEYSWHVTSGQLARRTVQRDNTGLNANTLYQYDDGPGVDSRYWSNVVEVVDAENRKTTTTYRGSLVATVTTPPTEAAPNGATTSYAYTCDGDTLAPLAVNDPAWPPDARQPCGLLSTMTDPDGRVTRYDYDRHGARTRTTTPTGAITDVFYGALGYASRRTVRTPTDPTGMSIDFQYDTRGRVVSETYPPVRSPVTGFNHQRQTVYRYDGDGNLAEQVDADISDPDAGPTDALRRITYGYDARDRQRLVQRNGKTVSQVEYDGMGHVTRSIDARGADYRFGYDANGLLKNIRLANYLSGVSREAARQVQLAEYTYDPAGRLATYSNAMGGLVSYRYTTDDLVTAETLRNYPDPETGQRRDVTLRQYAYDLVGNLVLDAEGSDAANIRRTSYTYDGANRRTSITVDPAISGVAHPLNRATRYGYDPAGLMTGVTVTDGARTESTVNRYDTGGQLIKTAVHNDATADLVTQYTRDALGRVLASTDPRGVASLGSTDPPDPAYTTTYTYDPLGRIATIREPEAAVEDGAGAAAAAIHPTTTFGFNTFGEQTDVRDARGQVTQTTFDTLGRRTAVTFPPYTAPDGTRALATAFWSYDDGGNVVSYRDRLNQVTTYTYDSRNRPRTATQPAANAAGFPGITTLSWDDNSNLLSREDANGGQVLYTYDVLDRPIQRNDVVRNGTPVPDSNLTSYRYDDFSEVTAILRADTVVRRSFDAAGELSTETSTGRGTTTYAYDVAGRPTSMIDPMGRRTVNAYDLAGRSTSVTDYSSSGAVVDRTLFATDKAGNVTGVTDPDQHLWSAAYDALNRVVRLTDPAPIGADGITAPAPVTSAGYDAVGQRTRVTDAKGQSTYQTYNAWGLPESRMEPATVAHPNAADRTWTTSYNGLGQQTNTTAPGAVTDARTYDNRGRLATETGTASGVTKAKTFDYDQAGRLASVSAPGGSQTFAYDDRGLLISSAGPLGNASYRYDSLGRLSNQDDASGHLTYTYGGVTDVRTLIDTNSATIRTYEHNLAGQVTEERDASTAGPSGPRRAIDYDDAGRPRSDIVTNKDGTPTVSLGYTWDPAGNLTSATTATGGATRSTAYTYDQDNRLIRAADTADGTGTDYAWDPVGNRTKVTSWTGVQRTPTGTTTATFDARNRLLGTQGPSTASSSYSWSPRGTLASTTTAVADEVSTTLTAFDAFNRLISDGNHSYEYDGLDRLAATTSGGARRAIGYAGLDAEPNNDGAWTYARTADGSLLSAATIDRSRASSLIANAHTDVVAGTDPRTGSVMDTRLYGPFGAVTGGTGTHPGVGYQGGWSDDGTGKVYAQTRWYDPGTGSFASPDQATVPLTSATAPNDYLYGGGNPVSTYDHTGQLGVPLPGTWTGFAGLLEGAAEGVGEAVVAGAGLTALEVGAVVVGALVVVAVAGLLVYAIVNADGSVSYQGDYDPDTGQPLTWDAPGTNPASPLTQVTTREPTITPKPVPVRTVTKTNTTSWQTTKQWYDTSYLYTRTDSYIYTVNEQWTYFSTGGVDYRWTDQLTHTWSTIVKPLIDLSNPIRLPTPKPDAARAPGDPAVANPGGICGQGGGPASCSSNARRGKPLPPEASDPSGQPSTSADGGRDKPPTTPPSDSCTPDPDGDWVDPNLINFSQRTVSPNEYVAAMLAGTWDWNRPGSALRVVDRGGQLVSYDNRRLDAARQVRAQDPNYRVKVERVDPNAVHPESTTGRTWDQSFERRMKNKRNTDENGCRVPWQGLFERPEVK
jgi:RHS repeat-associated protein